MADFSSLAAAEVRLTALLANRTWLNGHVGRATTGNKIVVRVQRYMSPTHPDYGAWVEIDQDNQT